MKTDSNRSGFLRSESTWLAVTEGNPGVLTLQTVLRKHVLFPGRKVASEILESLVSGFNLDIQYYIEFWGDTRNDVSQNGYVYIGMCYV